MPGQFSLQIAAKVIRGRKRAPWGPDREQPAAVDGFDADSLEPAARAHEIAGEVDRRVVGHHAAGEGCQTRQQASVIVVAAFYIWVVPDRGVPESVPMLRHPVEKEPVMSVGRPPISGADRFKNEEWFREFLCRLNRAVQGMIPAQSSRSGHPVEDPLSVRFHWSCLGQLNPRVRQTQGQATRPCLIPRAAIAWTRSLKIRECRG